MQDKIFYVLSIFSATVFSIIAYQGYDVFIGDQQFYIPPIQKALKSNLYLNDIHLAFSTTSFTFFDETVVFILKNSGMNLFLTFFFDFFFCETSFLPFSL